MFHGRIPLLAALTLAVAASTYAADGAALFGEYCASCHGTDGKAKTPAGRKLGAKDLGQTKLSDDQMAAQIANGSKNDRGAEKMPSFKDRLNATDIASLVQYVKGFRK